MEKAKVYYGNMRALPGDNLLLKLERVMRAAGMQTIDFDHKFVAVKVHFGEPGNLSYLRPNYARTVVDVIKSLGGNPFLTDCNTLYVGRRKNALEHLTVAYENGFTPYAVGCHVIIADGLRGTDETLVPINGEHFTVAKIGTAIMDADIVISLNHFKGHEATGFGGALKNLGMGCGSRAGKMDQHAAGKPSVEQSLCVGCGVCRKNCAHEAITMMQHKASIDHDKCVGCGRCIGVCARDAVHADEDAAIDILNKRIAEYALAVVQGRPTFHISVVTDVSPNCDCHGENDMPIVPNVGLFASFDPVALDMACADAVNRQPAIPGSMLEENGSHHHDHFTDTHPVTNWRVCLEHAEKLGIGTREYELIQVK